jgi:hypothetical protein
MAPLDFWNELQGIKIDSGGTTVVVSVDTCSFQILKYSYWAGSTYAREINYDEILEYELVIEGYTQVKTTRSIAKTLAGGLLFGPICAVVGSLSENNNVTLKNKNEFYFKFYIDDIELPYFEINCNTREQALKLQTTFKLWEEKIVKINRSSI